MPQISRFHHFDAAVVRKVRLLERSPVRDVKFFPYINFGYPNPKIRCESDFYAEVI